MFRRRRVGCTEGDVLGLESTAEMLRMPRNAGGVLRSGAVVLSVPVGDFVDMTRLGARLGAREVAAEGAFDPFDRLSGADQGLLLRADAERPQ